MPASLNSNRVLMSVDQESTTHPPIIARVTPRGWYRTVAIAESVTWTLLIVGMLLKYAGGLGSLPVLIGGSIHGFVFIAYGMTAVLIGVNQRWKIVQIVGAVATAIVPYATIPFDRYLERRGMLSGGWHLEQTDDPRDRTWARRLLRWMLSHPIALLLVFVVGIAVIMTALLVIGPPGGWGR